MLGRAGGGAAAGGNDAATKQVASSPTYRVPGASLAARAAASTCGGGSSVGAAGVKSGPAARCEAAASGGGPAPAEADSGPPRLASDDDVDADGFQQVRGKGWRKHRLAAAKTVPHGDEGADAGNGTTREGDSQSDPTAEGDAGDDDTRAPAPTELHRAWQDEVAVVRRLKAQGLAPQHPAMRAATEARDEAERAWREAKDPVPTPIRLARAQAKYDRALDLQREAHTALLEYEQQHREKLADLRAKLQEARERVSTRREQLEEIQCEVGAEAQGGRGTATQGAAAAREVHNTLCGTVAPTIAALVEQLDSSLPAWSVLNGLLGTLSSSSSTLERAFARGRGAQRFDIADAADGGETGARVEVADSSSDWSESHELPAAGDVGRGGDAAGGAADTRANANVGTRRDAARDDCDMETDDWGCDDFQDPYWGHTARWEECGHGKWARSGTEWADSWEREHGRSGGGTPELPPAARRRLEPAPATPQGTGGNGGGGELVDEARLIEQRKRQHADRLHRIVQAAIDAGVQPLTHTGEELQFLDPHQLDAWVAEHLPEGVPAR